MKTAEIIAIGTELLTPERVDTNSLLVTEQLNLLGVEVTRKQIIGDDRARLTEAIERAIERSHIVVLIGGLGPTEDDVTRDAAAAALHRKLTLSVEQESVLIQRFRQFNRPMAKNNLRQAYLLDGAEVLPNPNGTAPGQFISTDRGAVALLPGPPRELKPMLIEQLVPKLRYIVPPQIIRVRSFRVTGIGESDLDSLIAPVYSKYSNPVTTVLSSPGDLFVHLRATGQNVEQVDELLREVGNPIAEILEDRAYTEDANETLDMVVGRLLRKSHATVAVAESCTGGLLAARLTDQPGCSDYFQAGYVTYTEEQKSSVLNVPEALIHAHTAVSEPVAAAMAQGARAKARSTYALSVTGFAGPTGGTDFDPIGTVYIGLAGPHPTTVVRIRYGGDRYRTRTMAAQGALDVLRKHLLQHMG